MQQTLHKVPDLQYPTRTPPFSAKAAGGPSRGQTRVIEVQQTLHRSEVLELARGVDIGEELRVELEPRDVEILVGAVERKRPLGQAALQHG